MKKILWLATGGTISCTENNNGLSPAAEEKQLTKMLDMINIRCEVTPCCIMNIDSTNITFEHMKIIGQHIHQGITEGYDGIVVTHGTDTMSYTAAVIYNMIDNPPVPVIITGSQKPFFYDNSDGIPNLENAFTAACDERFCGVFIVFGDKLICAKSSHKEYTQSYNAFISPDGYASIIKNGKFTDINISTDRNCVYSYKPEFCKKVMVVKLTPALSPLLFEFAVNSGCMGIVLEGYGCGGVPSYLLEAIKKASQNGVKFILVSQCCYEGVSMDVYEVGTQAAACGIISGGTLTAEGALAQLMFSLTID